MRVVGGEDDLELAGWDGGGGDGLLVRIGQATGERADVVFLPRGGGGRDDDTRVVAPVGDGLWRRSPWPVRDVLFDLEPPEAPGAILVAGEPGGVRDEVAERLTGTGADVDSADRLTLAGLRAAAVVVLLGGHGALPALAPCVLAARRVLVTDAREVCFGLQDGIEFLGAGSAGAAVERAEMARLHPEATRSLRALGARAAREHRASLVYPRLAADLA